MSVSKDMKCPHSGGSRPSDKGGGGGGGGRGTDNGRKKNNFSPFGPQSGLKIWGGGGRSPRSLPRIHHRHILGNKIGKTHNIIRNKLLKL